jgi:hypothetical protein
MKTKIESLNLEILEKLLALANTVHSCVTSVTGTPHPFPTPPPPQEWYKKGEKRGRSSLIAEPFLYSLISVI